MAGFFFCLASAEGAGLLFCPAAIQPHTSVYSAFFAINEELYRPRHKTAHRSLQGLFPLICSIPAHTIQQPHKPPMHRPRHAGGHTIKRSISTDTRYHRRTGTLYSSAQPPIIIRYIRVRPCRGSMPDSAADRRPYQPGGLQSGTGQQSGRTLHPAGQSSGKNAAGGAEPLTAAAVSLFGLSPDSQ